MISGQWFQRRRTIKNMAKMHKINHNFMTYIVNMHVAHLPRSSLAQLNEIGHTNLI